MGRFDICCWCGKQIGAYGYVAQNKQGISMYRVCSIKCREEMSEYNKNKLCFITTAVCKAFNKPDDCLELTKFRHFRDTFMQTTPEMKAEIEEYYDIAPQICTAINLSGEKIASEKYSAIWTNSLKPAFEALDIGELEKTHDIYKKMVRDLQKEYL
ncbi:MAG: hypothetical protein Ta2B_16420 [Termitinemataceae bacterium]|nr:MAG: hypothetical protein Ta2B_16420 [Termitinemataceae bacterium]